MNKTVFVCEDNFDSIMTCIYDAWEYALSHGHESIGLKKEPVIQESFFDMYIHVEADKEKVGKVVRSIRKKISEDAYLTVYLSTLYKEDVLETIYDYLRLGFRVGRRINDMLTEACVMRLMEVRRNVSNEVGFFREIARFDSVAGVLVCHLEPKSNTIFLTSRHFADRMPSENWMMIDDNRRLAVVHPKDEKSYLRTFSKEELAKLKKSEELKDEYTDLWCTFFETIAIKQRENKRCQMNHFPVWTRKHATEFR